MSRISPSWVGGRVGEAFVPLLMELAITTNVCRGNGCPAR